VRSIHLLEKKLVWLSMTTLPLHGLNLRLVPDIRVQSWPPRFCPHMRHFNSNSRLYMEACTCP
jgi:hypothetical protein